MVGHDGDGVIEPYDLPHALTALAAASSTRFTRPPKTGDCARVAIFTPGGRTSMP
jgi:hypothetical protein